MRIPVFIIGLSLIVKATISFAQNTVSAQQITAESVAGLQRQGPDALGGIGDWHLSNGTLCAVISDLDHEGQFSIKGGNLIDLGYCDRADDFFPLTSDLIEGTQRRRFDAQSVASVNDDEIVVMSRSGNVQMRVRYYFDPAHQTQLQIEKHIELVEESAESFGFMSPLQFNYRSLEPFVFASQPRGRSNGFAQEDFVTRGVSAMTVAARPADTIITISPPHAASPISYGWRMRSATRHVSDTSTTTLPFFVLADDESTAMLVLSDDFYWGDGSRVGWLQLLQVPLLSLDFGEKIRLHETIYVSDRGDVAGVTDQILINTQTVTALSTEANTALHIDKADGTPLTFVRPDEQNRFAFKLPEGDYQYRLLGEGDRSMTGSFSVDTSSIDLGPLKLNPVATITLPQGEAMRLVFKGVNGTSDPSFNDAFTQASVADDDGVTTAHRNHQVFLAGVESDRRNVKLPDGEYEVLATRGPEFGLSKTRLSVSDAQDQTLVIEAPTRQIESAGAISADLHVHSGASFDNTFSDQERVRSFIAEHAEVMVSSEHDIPTDFAPIVEAMGLSDRVATIPAAEVTTLLPTKRLPHTSGHSNFFPYPPDPTAFARGMVNHENRRMREIIGDVRALHPDVLVQLNHPRHDLRLSGELPSDFEDTINNGEFFDHMGVAGHPYQPHKPITSSPNNVLIEPDPTTGQRDIDFDLLEVVNPGRDNYQDRLQAVRRDWLSLLQQGFRIVGVANSDSHGYDEQVGVPRTMVQVSDDSIAGYSESAFLSALRQGKAYGTSGPLLEVNLNEAGLGDTVVGSEATLNVTVTTSDWVTANTLQIIVNGKIDHTLKLDASEGNQKIEHAMSFEKDSFVIVEVLGAASEDYRKLYNYIEPYAFTNPIYVDADNDGAWTPPGL